MRIKRPSIQSIPSKLVKWIYSLLILLAITTNTFGGQLPITRANSTRPAECAAATFTGITDSQIQKNTTINVCYYFKITKTISGSNSDSDCQGSYNMPADQFCVEILQPNTTTTGCPAPTGITTTLYIYQTTCFYLKTVGTICAGSYTPPPSSPACTASKGSASGSSSSNSSPGSSSSSATAACSADGSCKQNFNCSSDRDNYIHTGYNDSANKRACLYTNTTITTCSSKLFYLNGNCFVDTKSSSSTSSTSNGLRSDGCPATPAATAKTPAITPSVNSAVGSQCFYTPLGTTTCATNYQSIGTSGVTICVGYKNNAQPTTVNSANSECPTPPNGAGSVYVLVVTCFFLATTSALCTGNYSFMVPDCYAVVKATTDFDKNGCPIPASVQATPQLQVTYQICYYQLPSGSQCATNYNRGISGATDCVAYTSGSSPTIAASGQCPTPPEGASTVYVSFSGNRCYFLTKDNSQCTDPYNNFDEPVCWANPVIKQNGTTNSLDLDTTTPNPGCPSGPVNGVTYTPDPNGTTCNGKDTSGTQSSISTTCSQGYITNSSGGCDFNASVDMPDVSSGPCTLKNAGEDEDEEGGPRLYTCPYANATLDCVINGSSSKTREDCYLGTGYDSTAKTYDSSLSYYECNLNSNNDPTSCWYYGPKGTAKTTLFASSQCPPPTNSGSSLNDCTITTCLDTAAGPPAIFESCSSSSLSTPFQATPSIIEVSIEQQCTSQQDGVVLNCTYVYTHHKTTKSKYYQLTCSQNTPINCTVNGPYNSKLHKYCDPQDSDTSVSVCHTDDVANGLTNPPEIWRGSCIPYKNSPNNSCTLFENNTNATNGLGTVACISSGTCTITDDGGNNMILTTCGMAPTYICKSMTPGCPVTKQPAVPTTTGALAESNLTCRGEAVMDSLLTPAMTSLTIKYPLSEGELQFVLKAIGVGSQSWLNQPGEDNLPGKAGGIVGL